MSNNNATRTVTVADLHMFEAIRLYAVAAGNPQLAHLCTEALGEDGQWAAGRIIDALIGIDTTHPDGLVARSLLAP